VLDPLLHLMSVVIVMGKGATHEGLRLRGEAALLYGAPALMMSEECLSSSDFYHNKKV